MFNTPKGNRLHISIFGKRNVGKSSFLNAFIGQDLSIVSATPGTTTDPLEKAYELQPIGPVVLIDTAGIDDIGDLGEKRVGKTHQIIKRTDFGIIVIDQLEIGEYEKEIIQLLSENKTNWLLVINKMEMLDKTKLEQFIKDMGIIYTDNRILSCSVLKDKGLESIKEAVVEQLGFLNPDPSLISDIVNQKDLVILVTPIDAEAPKNRLILPEAQTLRELLDNHNRTLVVQAEELKQAIDLSNEKPALVVTDSQAFMEVNRDTPQNINLTSFSILFARQKGDLGEYVNGVSAIDSLDNGDIIAISELCSHRPIGEDIGRVKIPKWLQKHTQKDLKIEVLTGKNYPEDVSRYKLIIQCGGCVANRKLILSRIQQAKNQGVSITNYGIIIAHMHGALKRALVPFQGLDVK